MQELASGEGKHPVSSFIFACSYIGTLVILSLSLPLSSPLPLFTPSFSFMLHLLFPLSVLSLATGLLAVCHHLKAHQVPVSGSLC